MPQLRTLSLLTAIRIKCGLITEKETFFKLIVVKCVSYRQRIACALRPERNTTCRLLFARVSLRHLLPDITFSWTFCCFERRFHENPRSMLPVLLFVQIIFLCTGSLTLCTFCVLPILALQLVHFLSILKQMPLYNLIRYSNI